MYATFPSAPPISWLTQYEFVDMIGAQNLWELYLGQPLEDMESVEESYLGDDGHCMG